MRAAVLGATGFIGRALVPALAERGEVVAVSRRGAAPHRPGVRAVAADLTDRASSRGALERIDERQTGSGSSRIARRRSSSSS